MFWLYTWINDNHCIFTLAVFSYYFFLLCVLFFYNITCLCTVRIYCTRICITTKCYALNKIGWNSYGVLFIFYVLTFFSLVYLVVWSVSARACVWFGREYFTCMNAVWIRNTDPHYLNNKVFIMIGPKHLLG